jgi:hypothetical protein
MEFVSVEKFTDGSSKLHTHLAPFGLVREDRKVVWDTALGKREIKVPLLTAHSSDVQSLTNYWLKNGIRDEPGHKNDTKMALLALKQCTIRLVELYKHFYYVSLKACNLLLTSINMGPLSLSLFSIADAINQVKVFLSGKVGVEKGKSDLKGVSSVDNWHVDPADISSFNEDHNFEREESDSETELQPRWSLNLVQLNDKVVSTNKDDIDDILVLLKKHDEFLSSKAVNALLHGVIQTDGIIDYMQGRPIEDCEETRSQCWLEMYLQCHFAQQFQFVMPSNIGQGYYNIINCAIVIYTLLHII